MTKITQSKWLEHFRFRFFPFDKLEAANEHLKDPLVLAHSFIEPDNFEKVFGLASSPTTSLLFADRGTGKTACRVMIDYYCASGTAPLFLDENGSLQVGYVLSVPHVHFIEVLEQYRRSKNFVAGTKPDIGFHVDEIMRRAVQSFVNLLGREIVFRRKIQSMPEISIFNLSRLISQYADYLLPEHFPFLEQLGLMPSAITKAASLKDESSAFKDVPAWFETWWQAKLRLSSLANLSEWADMIHQLGVTSTYVLVDGLDELDETAENPYESFEYVRPLLTNMRLIDGIPHLAVKFFLPGGIHPVVMANSGLVRLDRIPVSETIIWDADKLSRILQNRIATARSERDVLIDIGFNGLCLPGSDLEKDLIDACGGNPRYLMNLCALMVETHIKEDQPDIDDPYLLTRKDFKTALEQLDIKTKRLIYIADPSEYGYPYLQKLLKEGESETVEFKQRAFISTLELANNPEVTKAREVIKLTEVSIAKAIAGMMNVNGGILLIGVKDDGKIFGIEQDLIAIKTKNDPDGFNQRLSRLVEVYLGLENIRSLKTRFVILDGKMVCLIKIEKAYGPVYLKNNIEKKDKEGNAAEQLEFYIRGPAVTRKLNLEETKEHIEKHWTRNA